MSRFKVGDDVKYRSSPNEDYKHGRVTEIIQVDHNPTYEIVDSKGNGVFIVDVAPNEIRPE